MEIGDLERSADVHRGQLGSPDRARFHALPARVVEVDRRPVRARQIRELLDLPIVQVDLKGEIRGEVQGNGVGVVGNQPGFELEGPKIHGEVIAVVYRHVASVVIDDLQRVQSVGETVVHEVQLRYLHERLDGRNQLPARVFAPVKVVAVPGIIHILHDG